MSYARFCAAERAEREPSDVYAAAGHAIPSYTIPALERDAAENDEWAATKAAA